MLKKRIIAFLPIKNGIVVQSIGFARYLPIGRPAISVEFLNSWGIDEICLVKIDADWSTGPDLKLLAGISLHSRVPVTYGGGIRNLDDVRAAISNGADKVLLNRALLRTPELIGEIAESFGAQCAVASIDAFAHGGKHSVWDHEAKRPLDQDALELVKKVQKLGIGEILLNSVNHDGRKAGLDVEFILRASADATVPFIPCGGYGHPDHVRALLASPKVSGVAIGNALNFFEHSVTNIKEFLRQNGVDTVRQDSYFTYSDHSYLPDARVGKKADGRLDEMLFQHHPQEII